MKNQPVVSAKPNLNQQVPEKSKQDALNEQKSDLYKMRHTAEHVLHQAMKELYPSIHLAMGPATEEGLKKDLSGI